VPTLPLLDLAGRGSADSGIPDSHLWTSFGTAVAGSALISRLVLAPDGQVSTERGVVYQSGNNRAAFGSRVTQVWHQRK
jgi:hypothetical protein